MTQLKSCGAISSFPITTVFLSMVPDDAVQLAQQALLIGLVIASPLLVAGMVVGLLTGLLQALTQVQDQTLTFVPKIVAMVVVLVLALPWLVQKMMEYSESLIANIPRVLGG